MKRRILSATERGTDVEPTEQLVQALVEARREADRWEERAATLLTAVLCRLEDDRISPADVPGLGALIERVSRATPKT